MALKNRFLSAFLVLMLLFSIVACDKKNSDQNDENSEQSVEETSEQTSQESGEETSNDATSSENSSEETSEEESNSFVPPTPSLVEFKIDEKSSKAGLINCSFDFNIGGSYKLFFANEDGILEKYVPILGKDISLYVSAILKDYTLSNLVIPPEATSIIVVSSQNEEYIFEIDEKYLLSSEDVYVFGALSDVHYNRYNYSGEGDDAIVYFDNALDFLDTVGVDFVAIAGDISNNGGISAFENFNNAIKDRAYPVYTVTGNHDVNAVANGNWIKYMNLDIYDENNKEIVNVAENNLDFVYMPDGLDGDVFVFLSQVRWDYNKETSTLLDEEQLVWLEGVLETYKDKTVYLFFHSFLCGSDGEGHTGVGNLRNPGGYEYDLPYTYGTSDEIVFRNLLKKYKNVVYFSGHSHWMFEMEIYNEITNFSNFNDTYGYMVHVPSVTEPRYIGENDTQRTSMNGQSSQGWIIYDYGETTVFVPVDFITGTYYTQYMEIITNN